MKQILTATSLVLVVGVAGCKKGADDKTALALVGLAIMQSNAAAKSAAQVRAVSGAVSGAVATAANGNSVTFRMDRIPSDYNKMMAMIQQRAVKTRIDRDVRAQVIPTALSRVGGVGTCNSTGCSATLTGTANCPTGGSFSTTNLQVAFSIAAVSGLPSFSGTMKGDLTLNKCAATAVDYFRFPSYVLATATGDIKFDGTIGMTINSYSSTSTTATLNARVKDSSTVVSSNLSVNGDPAAAVNLANALDVNIVSVASNVAATSSGNIYTLTATYNDTLTGTASSTGTAAAGPVNVSRTYNGDKFTYNIKCTIDMTSFVGDCTVL